MGMWIQERSERPTEEASMYRQRRKQLRRRRRRTVTVVAVAVMAFVVSIPALASANPVDDLLHNLGLGGNSGSGSTGSTDSGGGTATPDAGSPPNYTPPLHGTNPHGQGTVGVVDITPSGDTPLSGD